MTNGASIEAPANATHRRYYAPHGGLPPQTNLLGGRAILTEAYAVIPKGALQDIVTTSFSFWHQTRAWVLARQMSGFAETFSQYIMEMGPGGGSEWPEPDCGAEAVLFLLEGGSSFISRAKPRFWSRWLRLHPTWRLDSQDRMDQVMTLSRRLLRKRLGLPPDAIHPFGSGDPSACRALREHVEAVQLLGRKDMFCR